MLGVGSNIWGPNAKAWHDGNQYRGTFRDRTGSRVSPHRDEPEDWADYSYVVPVGAFGYAMLTLLAVIFLHERVSLQRGIGVTLVCLGVLLVGRTKPRATGAGSLRSPVA